MLRSFIHRSYPGLTRIWRPCPILAAKSISQARTATGKKNTFPVQLTPSKIGHYSSLVFSLLDINTHTHKQKHKLRLYQPLGAQVLRLQVSALPQDQAVISITILILVYSITNSVLGRSFPPDFQLSCHIVVSYYTTVSILLLLRLLLYRFLY